MKKQAIVLIHGIGEQRPMDTATAFAETISGGSEIFYNPSHFGLQGEISRISIGKGRYRPKTDIYEYYWAHEFRDNKISTINNWFFHLFLACTKKLFCNKASRGDTPLASFFKMSKELLVVVAGLVYGLITLLVAASLIRASHSLTSLVTVMLIEFAIYKIFLSNLLFGYLADAAKYLSNHPDNISARERVRSGAIDLIRSLNESDEYDRVMVVGHSLGSVIGSDALTHYWHEVCHSMEHHPSGRTTLKQRHSDLMNYIKAFNANIGTIGELQKRQRLMREALCEGGGNWKISDFVSVGSPLSFANFLLARNDEDFRARTDVTRELLLCPPTGGEDKHLIHKNVTLADGVRGSLYPTSWSAFLYTRWTNIYGSKDLVGGPVAPLYGKAVMDICVESSSHLAAHVEYFARRSTRVSNQVISALKLETGRQRD
ncbi:hypothetical protein [Paraburkholderia xenovorans]